ncbi:hypothetical protein HN011_004046 [Eciton burchellii]|nr:hypothetical protein HN011_004046 [Eciton burchellii]
MHFRPFLPLGGPPSARESAGDPSISSVDWRLRAIRDAYASEDSDEAARTSREFPGGELIRTPNTRGATRNSMGNRIRNIRGIQDVGRWIRMSRRADERSRKQNRLAKMAKKRNQTPLDYLDGLQNLAQNLNSDIDRKTATLDKIQDMDL